MNKKWTAEQNLYIIENAGRLKDVELLAAFNSIFQTNHKLDCLRRQRQRLGVKKEPGRGINKLKDKIQYP